MPGSSAYIDGTIRKYLDDAASGAPTPGGGSISALAGALGVTMGRMAGNFTVGKKKFADVEDRVRAILAELHEAQEELMGLVDEDVQAYGAVSAAYGMPRNTPEEKRARGASIQDALRTAMHAPLRATCACGRVVERLTELVDLANPNLISDVGVSAILAEAALRGAKLNVEINLSYLKDEPLVAQTRRDINAIAGRAREQANEVVLKVAEAIGGTP